MNPVRFGLQELHACEARRWIPPDVGRPLPALSEPEAPPEPVPVPPTAEEIAAIEEAARMTGTEAGYQAGYQAGFQEGLDQALQQAAAEREARLARETELRASQDVTLRETVAALEAIAVNLADPLSSSADDLEPELLMLVTTLAKRVIMEEVITRPELIASVLRQALTQLPSRKHAIRVHLHPDDQAILQAYAHSAGESITWLVDPDIERGGCLIESGASRIDANLEARLRQSINAIWGELARPVDAGAPIVEPSESESEPKSEIASAPAAESAPDVRPHDAPTAADASPMPSPELAPLESTPQEQAA